MPLTDNCSALHEFTLFISGKVNFTGEQFLPFNQVPEPKLNDAFTLENTSCNYPTSGVAFVSSQGTVAISHQKPKSADIFRDNSRTDKDIRNRTTFFYVHTVQIV
jgi:hypothetical protein